MYFFFVFQKTKQTLDTPRFTPIIPPKPGSCLSKKPFLPPPPPRNFQTGVKIGRLIHCIKEIIMCIR